MQHIGRREDSLFDVRSQRKDTTEWIYQYSSEQLLHMQMHEAARSATAGSLVHNDVKYSCIS